MGIIITIIIIGILNKIPRHTCWCTH